MGVKTKKGKKRRPSHLRTVVDVARYLDYLRNEAHEHHVVKKIGQLGFDRGNSQRNRAEFEAAVGMIENLPATDKKSRVGRKRKWLAKVYIASTAENKEILLNTAGEATPMLSPDEREYYAQRFIEEARFGAVAYCWHIDKETGRCDCHFVVANCEPDEPAHSLKPWKASVFQRRISSDIIEGEINHQRRVLGQGLLTTMPERRKEIKREKGELGRVDCRGWSSCHPAK